MAAAVFGDFLRAGRLHLEAAVEPGDSRVACLPDVVPPLHRLVTMLSLYLEDLAWYGELGAAGRTDMQRAVVDAGAALRTAADCLYRSAAGLRPPDLVRHPASPRARHLAGAAAELAVGRDLLHTHIVLDPAGYAQERSEWAPVVTSPPVTRALTAEFAAWSARLGPFTARLADLATPHMSRALADQLAVFYPRKLASASHWLRAASAALRPAPRTDLVRAEDTDLLHAIPAALPPPRQPLDPAAESVAELCDGITISASRLRAAIHRNPDRDGWSPRLTSGGWQRAAQSAAVTSHLSELALRSLADRAAQLTSVTVTKTQLVGTAEALSGMRTAWQQVGGMWNLFITERRLQPTLAASEANDLLLRMGRLVWDNPQWTPARADRAPRRDPAALTPGPTAFAAVVSAAHQAADALARVAAADTATVQAAARAGRLQVPTRSLSARYDIPRAFAPPPPRRLRELRDAYHGAAEASAHAARELGELAIALEAPSKPLALARAAVPDPAPRRSGHDTIWPHDRSRRDPPRGVPFTDPQASTVLPGPVEQAVRQHGICDPEVLRRAAAIDDAARDLIALTEQTDSAPEPGAHENRDAVLLAAQSFPHDPAAGPPVSPVRPASRTGGLSPGRSRPRKN